MQYRFSSETINDRQGHAVNTDSWVDMMSEFNAGFTALVENIWEHVRVAIRAKMYYCKCFRSKACGRQGFSFQVSHLVIPGANRSHVAKFQRIYPPRFLPVQNYGVKPLVLWLRSLCWKILKWSALSWIFAFVCWVAFLFWSVGLVYKTTWIQLGLLALSSTGSCGALGLSVAGGWARKAER